MQNIPSSGELIDFFASDPILKAEVQRYRQESSGWVDFIKSFAFSVINSLNKQTNFEHEDLNFIFWCSDETQWRNQYPVIKYLNDAKKKIAFVSNKKRICELAESKGLIPHYVSTNFLLTARPNIIKKFFSQVQKISCQNESLKWVVIGNDLRWDDRVACKAFQLHGVRTAVINHGLNLITERLTNAICNVHFAWSENEKQRIISAGQPENKVMVSGSPALDETIEVKKYPEQEAVDAFISDHIGTEKSIVLITFSGPGGMISEQNHRAGINYLLSEADSLKKNNFAGIIKLHPKDNIEYYAPLLETGVYSAIPRDIPELNKNIYPWIRRAFALVSGPSGSIIDAMLLEKPAIYCDMQKEGYKINFVFEKIIPIIGEDKKLSDILTDLKKNRTALKEQIDTQATYLRKIYRNPDGRSSERIAEYLIRYA